MLECDKYIFDGSKKYTNKYLQNSHRKDSENKFSIGNKSTE